MKQFSSSTASGVSVPVMNELIRVADMSMCEGMKEPNEPFYGFSLFMYKRGADEDEFIHFIYFRHVKHPHFTSLFGALIK